MSENSYEKGRLNLPFVGFCTFAKSPICEDWDNLKADVAFMGAPFDCGTQWRSGARMGPRAVREASTLFSFGHGGAYSYEEDTMYLDGVRIVDIGDADMVHTNTEKSHANIEYGVRKILESGALPVIVGGITRLTRPASALLKVAGPFILSRLMLTWILLTSAMVCVLAMAIPCAEPWSNLLLPA